MPLKSLYFDNCKNATDLTPILEMTTLQSLIIPAEAKNVEQLRKLQNLQRLGYNRASSNLVPDCIRDEFWRAFDAKEK